jgi:hypothetical protein
MQPARIYRENDEIDRRLVEFGVTREELIEVVRAVVAARADAIDDDPASAEGLFAYIYGTRAIRQVFKRNGWLRYREDNVESVRHPDRNLKVIYQSVDFAADWLHSPKAVSGKGSGADRMIMSGQASLFRDEDLQPVTKSTTPEIKAGAYFFCVSVDGDDVRAELSLPSGIAKGNFAGFIERIFIVRPGEWSNLNIFPESSNGDAAEFEPSISRK